MKNIPGQLDMFNTPEPIIKIEEKEPTLEEKIDQIADYYGIIGEGKKKIKIEKGEAFYDGEPIEEWNARENETNNEIKNAPYYKGLR